LPFGCKTSVWVVLLALLAVGRPARAIVGGTPDPGDPAVVYLDNCTGTLISPRVILTAAHCVYGIDPSQLHVGIVGPSASTRHLGVLDAVVQPDYDSASSANDIAVAMLDEDVTDVAPVPLGHMPLGDDLAGQMIRVVGFGVATPGDGSTLGVKRSGFSVVRAVLATAMVDDAQPASTCEGDSGGPALLTVGGVDYVVGVTSRGDAQCHSFGVKTRVDPFVDGFIQPYVDAARAGGARTGAHCAYDAQCQGGTCATAEDDPKIRYCTSVCSRDGDCPQPMHCAGGSCRFWLPTPGAVGAPCSRNADCAGGVCGAEHLGGPYLCTIDCEPTAPASCPAHYACKGSAAGPICVPAADADSGCSAAPTESHGSLFAAAAFLLLALRRRQRR
jgi:MYXO-CTERM domain-containing protein